MFAAVALMAASLEAIVGYPDFLFRAIGHPVSWTGALIAWCDRTWNSPAMSADARRTGGVCTVALLLAVSIAAGEALAMLLPPAILAIVGSSLLAQRSLHQHVAAVASELEAGDIAGARVAVGKIVGRDTACLDEQAVSRAAVESLAENFSDGVVAPLFWMTLAGLPGALAYKAINTADSMIGHKSERHLAFGWAAARLDDLLNLPAARLAALWLAVAATFVPAGSVTGAWRSAWRDAGKHASPNAGWPEAAMAGALGLKLGGPRSYEGDSEEAAWLGDGRHALAASDIRLALRLYRIACLLQMAALLLLVLATLPS